MGKWRQPEYGLVLSGLLVLFLIVLVAFSARPTIKPSTIDLSWPNCSRLPLNSYRRIIVGINGGLDFRPNPCLADEALMTNKPQLYVNSGNPGWPKISQLGSGPLKCRRNELLCFSYNYGYQAARYDIKISRSVLVNSRLWWIDVESDNSWTNNQLANRADITGMIDGLSSVRIFKPQIGVYTTLDQWPALVGSWRPNLPLWLGTGANNISSAKTACHDNRLIGGPIELTQYTFQELDYNISCRHSSSSRYAKLGLN